MEEEQIHIDAFELYFQLRQSGLKKTESAIRTGSEYNRNKSTIFEWKKIFNWDDREAIRSAEINREVQKQTNSTITENKVQYLTYYHKLLDELKNDIEAGNGIKIRNPHDLKLVIDGALILQGETTERSESVTHDKNNFDQDEMTKILQEEGYDTE